MFAGGEVAEEIMLIAAAPLPMVMVMTVTVRDCTLALFCNPDNA